MALIVKPPCDRCGQPYLKGSSSTCLTCLQHNQFRTRRRRQEQLECDCGQAAAAVIYVSIRIGENVSLEPLVVCATCLDIEMETQKDYL